MDKCKVCGDPAHRPMSDINYDGLPLGLQSGFKGYIESHIPMGGFAMAVVRNDLTDAFGRADANNRERLFDIVKWLYNEAPGLCWGSSERVMAWLSPDIEVEEAVSDDNPE